MAQAKKKEVAKTTTKELSTEVTQFEQFAGTGFEETGVDDLAIPFIRILDASSPQCNKRHGAYVEGASAGMIFNTVLNEVYDGEEGICFVSSHYNQRFVEWVPRDEGGGYVDSHLPTDDIVGTTQRDEKNQDVLPNGNTLSKTAQFFGFIIHPEHGPLQALLTMNSTQLKKAKTWNSQMQSLKGTRTDGTTFIMPMMSQVYRLKTVPESNDKGDWFGWQVTRERQLNLEDTVEKTLFDDAMAFHDSVFAGEVKIKPEDQHLNQKSKAPDISKEPLAQDDDDEIPF